jgi:gamma-glutamylcyclotransferase (GGCT)/AIG2-like uncharacterized protein YtfP
MSRCSGGVWSASCAGCSIAEQQLAVHHPFLLFPSSCKSMTITPTTTASRSALSHNVFVYGTLKRGQYNHHWIDGGIYLGRRQLRGVQLHHLGAYPMAVLTGSDAVSHGELYRVKAAGLNHLDQLEGYPGFYDRTELQLCDGTTAWVYHGRLEQVSKAPLIPLGDWDTTPVLHYGSNLDPERLQQRCPDWDGEGLVVQLEGWSWAIDKQTWGNPASGFAGIRPCDGATTWGVVTHHTAIDLAELDEAEGVRHQHYRRQRVVVRRCCGAAFEALAYVPCDHRRREGLYAESWYRNHILRGLDHWQLPAAWRFAIEESLCTTA